MPTARQVVIRGNINAGREEGSSKHTGCQFSSVGSSMPINMCRQNARSQNIHQQSCHQSVCLNIMHVLFIFVGCFIKFLNMGWGEMRILGNISTQLLVRKNPMISTPRMWVCQLSWQISVRQWPKLSKGCRMIASCLAQRGS